MLEGENMSNLHSGNLVKVRAYGDAVLTRRCAGVQGETVLICNEAEYEAALREQREPTCVGFPISDVIDVLPEDQRQDEQ